MTEICANINAELQGNHQGLTALAQLVAIYTSAGTSSAAEIAERTGYSERAIRKAKAELGCRNQSATEPECRNPGAGSGTPVPDRNPGAGTPVPSSRARIETPTGLLSSEEVKHSPPTPSVSDEPREGEEELENGVFVNCKTIRHRDFAISLTGIEMNTQASAKPKDQIKAECLAHALQWAAEIAGGKRPDQVLPSKIANFLASSIMGTANRAAVQGVRLRKAGGQDATGKPKKTVAEIMAEKYAHEGAAA